MFTENVPWRFLIGRYVLLKYGEAADAVCRMRDSEEEWILAYCYLDTKFGFQFLVLGLCTYPAFRITRREDRKFCIRYERAVGKRIVVSAEYYMSDDEKKEMHRKAGERVHQPVPDRDLRKVRSCAALDAWRMKRNPDLLEVPDSKDRNKVICVRPLRSESGKFYAVTEEKGKTPGRKVILRFEKVDNHYGFYVFEEEKS